MIQALVFDLDDTLYREKDFVESGFKAVARHVASNLGCDYEEIYHRMIDTQNTSGRRKAMEVIISQFPERSFSIGGLVSVFRNHQPDIHLFPGYHDLLRRLSQSYRLGIITDGLPEVQENKIRALKLDGLMDSIIYSWRFGEEKQKPHPHSFNLILKSLQTEAPNALFVGDNPLKDCIGAHRAGMKCAQVRSGVSCEIACAGIPGEQPEFVIDTLFQLPPILQGMN